MTPKIEFEVAYPAIKDFLIQDIDFGPQSSLDPIISTWSKLYHFSAHWKANDLRILSPKMDLGLPAQSMKMYLGLPALSTKMYLGLPALSTKMYLGCLP